MNFLKDIAPEDVSTWQNKSFIEFDVDWASEEIIEYSYNIIKEAGISATWFSTHDSGVVRRIERDKSQDIGIHPNFVPNLICDMERQKPIKQVFSELMNLYPRAKVMKSHSLVDSTIIQQTAKDFGITHDNNIFIPDPKVELNPWRSYNGIIRLPLRWEDDTACLPSVNCELDRFFSVSGLKIFGFHPIHVFLNTENLNRYEETRKFHQCSEKLRHYRFEGNGTETRLKKVVEYILENNG